MRNVTNLSWFVIFIELAPAIETKRMQYTEQCVKIVTQHPRRSAPNNARKKERNFELFRQ